MKCYIEDMSDQYGEPRSIAELSFAEMIERGEIIPATSPGDLSDIEPLPPREDGVSLADALIALREEERW
jgi:hypothetical protein